VEGGFNPLAAAAGFLAPQPSTRSSRARAGSAPNIPCRAGESLTDCVARRRRVASGAMTSLAPLPRASLGPTRATRAPVARSVSIPSIPDIPSAFPCILPWRIDPDTGDCKIFAGEQVGRDDTPIGEVVMGRYGAGEMPGNMVVNRAICRPGMVVGDDGVCYNKSQIRNSQREWPRGRRPLLTGGDMRAISVASRAGKRLERTTKRLQKIGLMKKAAPRRISAAAVHHAK